LNQSTITFIFWQTKCCTTGRFVNIETWKKTADETTPLFIFAL